MSIAPAPASRLAACPCGSGKRYKDCCGSLAMPPAAAASRRSAYRASGDDWIHLPELERDRLGELMEAALVHHREGRLRDAERNYREVLAVAPQTHDALHMLAMVRWREQDFAEARRLIEEALPLRPEYPAIRRNLARVRSAQRAHERSAHEALCELALPRFFDELRSAAGGRAPRVEANPCFAPLHLIGVDDGSDSDDAWMLRRLAQLLAPLDPIVWPAQGGGARAAPARIDAPFPRGGTQVFVGADLEVGAWLPRSEPRQTIVFAQSARPSRWLDALRAIAGDGALPITLVVESQAKAAHFGGGHRVLVPPIDLNELRRPRDETRGFVVGCVVQDGRVVAHARAAAPLQRIAAQGIALDLLDPGRARDALGAMRHVRCVSRREIALPDFLAPLSCLLYRADAWWEEGSGRDLFGAMAAGIPVVCPRASIYAEYLRDGIDGLLYDDEEGALGCLVALRDDRARLAALGAAARESVARRFEPAALAAAVRGAVIGG